MQFPLTRSYGGRFSYNCFRSWMHVLGIEFAPLRPFFFHSSPILFELSETANMFRFNRLMCA